MRQLILLTLFIALLTGCASTQPAIDTSPLAQSGPAMEVHAQSPLSPPVASQVDATPTQTPPAAKPAGEPQSRFFLPMADSQPTPEPTPIVIDFTRTSPAGVEKIRSQMSMLVVPLLGALESAAPFTQESLLSAISASVPPWASASHRRFLPLVVNLPIDRLAEAKKLFNCRWVHRLTPSECEILVLFYLDTNGPHWREQRNWLQDPDPCRWGSMQCYDGHVRVLQEENNRLTGILTPEIDNLPITFLLLANNALQGSVPDSLVRMKQLEAIDLSRNQLTGPLHPDIAKFPNLRTFNFDRDKLWFNTDAFTCDSVTTIPKAECEALVAIYRSMGGEDWVVKTVYAAPPTGQGYLFANEWLVGPNPCWWKGINCVEKRVDILNLEDSNLWGRVSPDFGKLVNLGQLNLSKNHLYGPLPIEFRNLTMLRYLRLGGNVRPPAVADDPAAHLCIPGAVFLRLEHTLSAEDMPPGGFCP